MKIYYLNFIIFIIFLGLYDRVHAENKKLDFDTYIPPTSSTLCASLKKTLQERRRHKQKLAYLLARNKTLQKEVSKRRKSIIAKLRENQTEIKIHQQKNLLQIQSIEEKVIRKGCPGILTPSFEEKEAQA